MKNPSSAYWLADVSPTPWRGIYAVRYAAPRASCQYTIVVVDNDVDGMALVGDIPEAIYDDVRALVNEHEIAAGIE